MRATYLHQIVLGETPTQDNYFHLVQKYLANKLLQVAGMSADNVCGWEKNEQKMNIDPLLKNICMHLYIDDISYVLRVSAILSVGNTGWFIWFRELMVDVRDREVIYTESSFLGDHFITYPRP